MSEEARKRNWGELAGAIFFLLTFGLAVIAFGILFFRVCSGDYPEYYNRPDTGVTADAADK